MNLFQQHAVIILDRFLAEFLMSYFPTIEPAFSVSHKGNIVIPAHSGEL